MQETSKGQQIINKVRANVEEDVLLQLTKEVDNMNWHTDEDNLKVSNISKKLRQERKEKNVRLREEQK